MDGHTAVHRSPALGKRLAKYLFPIFYRVLMMPPSYIDKLKSYSAARWEVIPSVTHSTEQYENNPAEVSHEPMRQRERRMRRFKSAGQAQRFLAVYGVVGKLFRLGRHLTRAIHYREFHSRAFCEWQEVTCAQIMA